MSNIKERLKAYAETNEGLGFYTEAKCAYDAIDEIDRLRATLRYIANDYVELSHDKVLWQRNDHVKMARKALAESYKDETVEPKPLNDDF